MAEHSYFYFVCSECQFDFIGNEHDAVERIECPLCASDSGHSNIMTMRAAKPEDKVEGHDARKV